jgi:hypothetical protein
MPTDPILVGSFAVPGAAEDIQVVSNYAYVALGKIGLALIDIRTPTAPTRVSTYWPGSAWEVRVVGSSAYVAAGNSVLIVIDVSDPAHPTVAASLSLPEDIEDMQVVGDYAYVAKGHAGLAVMDVRDPTTPTLVGRYDPTVVPAEEVQVVSDYAYVIGYDYGNDTAWLQVVEVRTLPL